MTQSTQTKSQSIEELEALLKAAKEEAAAAIKAKQATVKPRYAFEINPVPNDGWDYIHDSSIKKYRITGVCINKEELKFVNLSTDNLGGGMTYLYNTATSSLICSTGGGMVWLSDGKYFSGKPKPHKTQSFKDHWEAISIFIANNPDGGDITSIMNKYRDL